MDLIYPILALGLLAFLGSFGWERLRRGRTVESVTTLPAGAAFSPKPLLTDQEAQLYNLLRLAVEDRYLLFTQIPLWCLLDLQLPSGTPPVEVLRALALKRATFVLVHPGSRLVEKVVQVERRASEDPGDGATDAGFDAAFQAAGVQLVRLSAAHAYTVSGLITLLDLADPE